MIIPELDNYPVEDASDMEDALCEQLESYVHQLSFEEGMTREWNEDDPPEAKGCLYMWTDKAARAYETLVDSLHVVAGKYFPGEDFDIKTSMYQEF